jgi:queuine/archaeosine tRNA-ribosyltransferase
MHNLWFYNNFFKRIREALDAGTFEAFRARNLGRYSKRV